jgi:hypothetical protein
MAEHAPASIDRNISGIKQTIRDAFQTRGLASVDVEDIRVSLEDWRKRA